MRLVRGEPAPPVVGATHDGPHALVFYKVTCPTCRMAAPSFETFASAYPGRTTGIGQDPADALARFGAETGMTFPATPDLDPYEASVAYGIEHVPTLVVVDGDGRVADIVESWDRDGVNRASSTLAALVGADPVVISEPGDGLPDFRPG
jgi:thiol-disulfide isomerase/thioredoxin